jgi:membrane protease YdiL (CAAX protease family)
VEQKKAVPVSPLEAVLVIVVTFFASIAFNIIFYFAFGEALALVFSELVILIIPLGYLLYKRVDVKSYVGLDVNPELVLWGVVSAVILLAVDIGVSAVLLTVFGESQAVIDVNIRIVELTASPGGLIAVAAALGLAGVCEEFAFRGFLQNTLTRRFSFIPALIFSALVFGLFHPDPQLVYIISAMTAGIVLGYVYHRWNSYLVAVIAHSSVNLLVLVMLLLEI